MTRILVAEDDFDTRFLITSILQMAGYETCEADHGEEVLEILQDESRIDLVLSDILMSGINGLEILEHIREQYPHIPVILVSAHANSAWVQKAMQKGAACYLLKPFTREQLITIVGDVISSQFQPALAEALCV